MSILPQLNQSTPVDMKRQTENATIARIFAAKSRHDRLVEEAIERTARQTPSAEPGEILWI